MVKTAWDVTGLKSGTPFLFMSRLVKILKLAKILLKIGMVVLVTVECQSWAESNFVLKVLLTNPAPVHTLQTTHTILMYIHTQAICF